MQEEIKINVLKDGFVRLVDTMGDDSSIVQAARVSYGKGTKTNREDRGLIRYLVRNRHTSPLEMCEIKLHVRLPIDVARQWIRHRTASVNEYSTRYSEAIDAVNFTAPEEWRLQSKDNKQGSGGSIPPDTAHDLSVKESFLYDNIQELYQLLLKRGVAREQARKVLPLCNYTEWYFKMDLHNLFHFLKLRMDNHAQYEIRLYANAIADIVKQWVPLAYEAFEDYVLNSIALSSIDKNLIKVFNVHGVDRFFIASAAKGFMELGNDNKLKKNTERDELSKKMKSIGFIVDWSNKSIKKDLP